MAKSKKRNPDPARKPVGRDRDNDREQEKREREVREKGMDKTLADSYPASDAPSTIPDPAEDPAS